MSERTWLINGWRFWWLSLIVIVLDQATKLYFEALLKAEGVISVFPGFNLALAYNPGAAFSFLGNASGWQRWFFVALSIGISAVIVVWARQAEARDKRVGVPLALILGGAIGNLIDRIAYGVVIDFLDVYYKDWHWPTFNIADSAISVGVACLIAAMLFPASKHDAA